MLVHAAKAARRHADHAERKAVDFDHPAKHRPIATPVRLPVIVADDDVRLSPGSIALRGDEQPPDGGVDAEHVEVVRRDELGRVSLRPGKVAASPSNEVRYLRKST